MTVLYLQPSNDRYMEIKRKLQSLTVLPPSTPVAPEGLDAAVYNEIYCLTNMLRPNDYNPSKGWMGLR